MIKLSTRLAIMVRDGVHKRLKHKHIHTFNPKQTYLVYSSQSNKLRIHKVFRIKHIKDIDTDTWLGFHRNPR